MKNYERFNKTACKLFIVPYCKYHKLYYVFALMLVTAVKIQAVLRVYRLLNGIELIGKNI